jgi:hypothetical protein
MARFTEIISHQDMCHREQVSLQQGMNFRADKRYSIVLMSVRKGAPYQDTWHEDRGVLEYEGHDKPRRRGQRNPKHVDQPLAWPSGRPNENGKFFQAAMACKAGEKTPRPVHVYEKIARGVWCDRGKHELIDAEIKVVPVGRTRSRNVCRFYLRPAAGVKLDREEERELTISRVIPTAVKVEVWRRDQGRCVTCGATDNLHFDHDVPYSKGGSSITAQNVRLMCARHNLSKGDKIMTLGPLLGPLVSAVVASLVKGA